MNKWVKDNPALVIGFFTLLIAAFGIVVALRGSAFTEALAAKDATIELLMVKINEMESEKKAQGDQMQFMTSNQNVLGDTIDNLHKRISELESNQFFERSPDGRSIQMKESMPPGNP